MSDRYTILAHRAGERCEYCRAPEQLSNSAFELEHIYPRSRGGSDELGNLAFACRACNRPKSDHIAGYDEITGEEQPLFNPRADRWAEHFVFDLESGRIDGVSAVGRVTVAVLDMNHPRQIAARLVWARLGRYP